MSDRKLGKGLDSLLGDVRATEGEEVIKLRIDDVRGSPYQPRRDLDDSGLAELAASVKESGVLQPIIVRPAAGGAPGYEIVAGERRARAAKLAGLTEVPALVRSYSDNDVLVLSLVENVQRRDLNPIDRARAYRRLITHLSTTQEEVARRIGLDRSSVANMIRLLDLPEEVQELVTGGALSAGHARALLGLRDDVDRLKVAEKIVKEGLSVRAVEEIARQGGPVTPKRRSSPRKTPQVAALEGELRTLLATKVSIQDRRGKGRILIEYYSPEEFQRILEVMRGGGVEGARGFGYPDS